MEVEVTMAAPAAALNDQARFLLKQLLLNFLFSLLVELV
jgi:hypothetical protein